MKKIIILLTLFSCTVFYGQAEFDAGVQITGGQPTVTTSTHITTTEVNGVQGKILGENISIDVTPPVSNYVPLAPNIKGHLQGIDFAIGNFVTTTAGITNRIYFTADPVTLSTGTYYLTNGTGKGAATSAIQGVTNDDNIKQYFAQDLISIAQPLNLTVPAGSFSGQLTTMISTDPASQQQRYTVELYLCDTNGTPLNSGIPGAPVGGLGVTVVAILDSGLINLVAGNLTNINITGSVTAPLSVTAGQRFRYHVSAEKVGTGGSSIVMQVMYGNLYNSYYDVPVTFDTNSVLNRSTVTGTTTTNALDYLNVNKAPEAGSANYIQNQNSTTQTANLKISGSGSFNGSLYLTDTSGIPALSGGGLTGSFRVMNGFSSAYMWIYGNAHPTKPDTIEIYGSSIKLLAPVTANTLSVPLTVRKISTNITLADSDNGKIILLTASATITLPNGLMSGFNCSFSTLAGVTLTYSLGGSVVLLNNLGITMAEKLSHTIVNTGVANEYLTAGSL